MNKTNKKLMAGLLRVVRGDAVRSTYNAAHGWDAPFEHGCELCGAKWKPGQREAHEPKCLIARADKTLNKRPRVVPLRPL